MPLALAAVASALDRRRYAPVIVDGRLETDPVGRLVAECADALALGVTALTGAPLGDALAVTRRVKQALPALPVVWGGWHPSLFASECVREETAIDAVVVGQGEDTFAEILDRLEAGASLDGLAGAATRRADGTVAPAPPSPLRDLNARPAHDYDLLAVERYCAKKRRRQLDYVSSQGCRFRCAFCADPGAYARAWTSLAPERVGDEAAFLHRRHRI